MRNISSKAKRAFRETALEICTGVLVSLDSPKMRSIVGNRFTTEDSISISQVDVAGDCHVVPDLVFKSASNLGTPSSQRLQAFFTEAQARYSTVRCREESFATRSLPRQTEVIFLVRILPVSRAASGGGGVNFGGRDVFAELLELLHGLHSLALAESTRGRVIAFLDLHVLANSEPRYQQRQDASGEGIDLIDIINGIERIIR